MIQLYALEHSCLGFQFCKYQCTVISPCLHHFSALIREYPPKETLASPEFSRLASIMYTIICEKSNDGSDGFERAISCLKQGTCLGCPDSNLSSDYELDDRGQNLYLLYILIKSQLTCNTFIAISDVKCVESVYITLHEGKDKILY